jgi:two-component system, NarL family, response regulator NreC
MKIRVLIVDDFPLIREGFAHALTGDPAIEVVGQADNGRDALRLAAELQPDVMVLDLYMPEFGGMMVLERLHDASPNTKALVVSASERAEMLLDAVAAGANGYLTKRVSREELRQAVITVHGGGSMISPALASVLIQEYSRTRGGEPSTVRALLGARDQEILRLVAQGHTDREIGKLLHISPRTVQNHLTRIRERTGLKRRSELARWAVQHAVV